MAHECMSVAARLRRKLVKAKAAAKAKKQRQALEQAAAKMGMSVEEVMAMQQLLSPKGAKGRGTGRAAAEGSNAGTGTGGGADRGPCADIGTDAGTAAKLEELQAKKGASPPA